MVKGSFSIADGRESYLNDTSRLMVSVFPGIYSCRCGRGAATWPPGRIYLKAVIFGLRSSLELWEAQRILENELVFDLQNTMQYFSLVLTCEVMNTGAKALS